jgi:hypothetical protein
MRVAAWLLIGWSLFWLTTVLMLALTHSLLG